MLIYRMDGKTEDAQTGEVFLGLPPRLYGRAIVAARPQAWEAFTQPVRGRVSAEFFAAADAQRAAAGPFYRACCEGVAATRAKMPDYVVPA